jgi:hypothetical protein
MVDDDGIDDRKEEKQAQRDTPGGKQVARGDYNCP